MRYDTAVWFQTVTKGAFDEDTGNYGEPTVTEVSRTASVIETGDEAKQLIYGNVREKSRTISLLNSYNGNFDRIRIGDTLYQVDKRTTFRRKQAFIVSEIPGERWSG